MSTDDYDFKVNEILIPFIMDGDNSNLVNDEQDEVESFLTEHEIETVELLYNGEDIDKCFARCDISGLMCMTVRVLCYKHRNFKLTRV